MQYPRRIYWALFVTLILKIAEGHYCYYCVTAIPKPTTQDPPILQQRVFSYPWAAAQPRCAYPGLKETGRAQICERPLCITIIPTAATQANEGVDGNFTALGCAETILRPNMISRMPSEVHIRQNSGSLCLELAHPSNSAMRFVACFCNSDWCNTGEDAAWWRRNVLSLGAAQMEAVAAPLYASKAFAVTAPSAMAMASGSERQPAIGGGGGYHRVNATGAYGSPSATAVLVTPLSTTRASPTAARDSAFARREFGTTARWAVSGAPLDPRGSVDKMRSPIGRLASRAEVITERHWPTWAPPVPNAPVHHGDPSRSAVHRISHEPSFSTSSVRRDTPRSITTGRPMRPPSSRFPTRSSSRSSSTNRPSPQTTTLSTSSFQTSKRVQNATPSSLGNVSKPDLERSRTTMRLPGTTATTPEVVGKMYPYSTSSMSPAPPPLNGARSQTPSTVSFFATSTPKTSPESSMIDRTTSSTSANVLDKPSTRGPSASSPVRTTTQGSVVSEENVTRIENHPSADLLDSSERLAIVGGPPAWDEERLLRECAHYRQYMMQVASAGEVRLPYRAIWSVVGWFAIVLSVIR